MKHVFSNFRPVLGSALLFIATTATAPAVAETARPASTKEASKSNAKEAPKGAEKSGDQKVPLAGFKDMFQESPTTAGGPLYIKSDTLELNSKARLFIYKGNVELVRADVTITANIVEGKYDRQNRLETILCRGNVVITKGEGMRATSNRALYNVSAATIELTEAPELYREGNALSADKVTVYIDEDRSEAEGNVRVKVIKPTEGAS